VDTRRLIRLSKLLSLILRHQPEQFGIILDPEGYADLREVLLAVQTQVPDATETDLRHIVTTIETDKQRFSIDDGDIRANYGHSLADRIQHQPVAPPAILWHGTTEAALRDITTQGILPMKRQYVHLTTDERLAIRIGSRHGAARTIRIDAARAHAEGILFYRANDTFWLADEIAPRYLDL
jgi:putative RNA 2'-phosphotransferase